MKSSHAALLLCLMLSGSACSWFRHKDASAEPAAPSAPTVDSAASADAAPAPASEAPAAPEPAADTQGPAAVAVDFLSMHQRFGNSGLPDAGSMSAYSAFLCPSLVDALRAAQVRQEQFKASHPDEKPPLAEGDLFSSLFEGPETFAATDTRIEGGQAQVDLAMSFGEGKSITRWSDTFQFELDDGIWCLADVQYHGKWPFANKGRLRDALAH